MSITQKFFAVIDKIQGYLDYSWCKNDNFNGDKALGKIGTTGFVLGLLVGFYATCIFFCSLLVYFDFFPSYYVMISSMLQWAIYSLFLFSFHFLEFFTTALYQNNNLSYHSYIINHSKSYTMASLACFIEFSIETYFCGEWKRNPFIVALGVVTVFVGQALRTTAMVTCGANFSHQIMSANKSQLNNHSLVTHGIYKYLRHPSYCGWFWWSVGTQIILFNPICLIGYFYASWSFFNERVPFEEKVLINVYGIDYQTYMSTTYIGIPFIASPVNNTNASFNPSSVPLSSAEEDEDE